MLPLSMYSRQCRFALPHLCLMLDTCPRVSDNFCLSFHNEGNVLPRLTRKNGEMNLYPLSFAIHFSSLCVLDSLGWSFMLEFCLLPFSLLSLPHGVIESKSQQLSSGRDKGPKRLHFLEIFILSWIFPILVRGHDFGARGMSDCKYCAWTPSCL